MKRVKIKSGSVTRTFYITDETFQQLKDIESGKRYELLFKVLSECETPDDKTTD